ncbi:MAG: hypothetical protein ACO3HD_05425, partial [Burkholderiaceae bacterium]
GQKKAPEPVWGCKPFQSIEEEDRVWSGRRRQHADRSSINVYISPLALPLQAEPFCPTHSSFLNELGFYEKSEP